MEFAMIKFPGRRLPLVFTGQTAEHLMVEHQRSPHIHPYLHIQAQQYAKVGKLYYSGGKRYVSLAKAGEHFAGIGLFMKEDFVVISGCVHINNKDFAKLRQVTKNPVSGVKKKAITLADIQFSDEENQAIEAMGIKVIAVRKAMLNMLTQKGSKKRHR